MHGIISEDSPFGKALMSKKEGDTVTVNAPAGEMKCRDSDGGPDGHLVGGHIALRNDDGVEQDVLQLADAGVELALLVLGLVILALVLFSPRTDLALNNPILYTLYPGGEAGRGRLPLCLPPALAGTGSS